MSSVAFALGFFLSALSAAHPPRTDDSGALSPLGGSHASVPFAGTRSLFVTRGTISQVARNSRISGAELDSPDFDYAAARRFLHFLRTLHHAIGESENRLRVR